MTRNNKVKNRHCNQARDRSRDVVTMPTPKIGSVQSQRSRSFLESSTDGDLELFKIQNGAKTCRKYGNDNETKETKPRQADDMISDTRGNAIQLFPRNLHWFVFIATLLFRLWYVSMPNNWWVLHPDEIFQTMEVAHSETFGYGFRPYEYLAPPVDGVAKNAISSHRAEVVKRGMYSMRSFLLVKVIAFVMATADFCGTTLSPFMVTKLFHVVVSSSLPLAVFKFAKSLTGSRDSGILAAIFVSSSVILNVLGTHTLINSFLSPFLFYSLASYVELVQFKLSSSEKSQKANSKPETATSRFISTNGSQELKSNYTYHRLNATEVIANETTKTGMKTTNMKMVFREIGGCWETFSQSGFWSGLGLAICMYVRPDISLMPLLLATLFCKSVYKNILNIVFGIQAYTFGFVTGIFIGGYVDRTIYGDWFLSPMQWFRFNVLNKYAGAIYGASPYGFYVDKLVEHEPLIFILSVTLTVDLIFTVLRKTNFNKLFKSIQHINPDDGCNTKRNILSGARHVYPHDYSALFMSLILLFIYSLNDHKEVRFIHSGIILMYVSMATAVIRIISFVGAFANQNDDKRYVYYVYLFIALFVTRHIHSFMLIRDQELTKWTFAAKTKSNEINICLDFLRQQDDVTGVLIDRPLYVTGLYSILHKDVPIWVLHKNEFMEYDKHSRVTERSGTGISFSVFGHISDLISVYNTPYLLKRLIEKTEYNYLILMSDRDFINIGYYEVLKIGDTKIMKRSFVNESEVHLAEIAERIPTGSNATVLEVEGASLKHFGLYSNATLRLLLANRLDQSRLGPFQLLMNMFEMLGNSNDYESVLRACLEVHSHTQCLKPYEHLSLNSS